MKRLILGILMVACCLLAVTQTTSAHILVTDESKTQGAVLHIIPDDDPVAGEEATLYFDMQENMPSKNNAVQLSITDTYGDVKKIDTKVDGSLVTANYTFATQGVYKLVFTISPDGNAYIFKQSQRVSRGVSGDVLLRPSYAWAEILVIASSVSFACLLIIAFNRRKGIAKHSTF